DEPVNFLSCKAARNADGRLEVFYYAADNGLRHAWQDAPNSGPWYSASIEGAHPQAWITRVNGTQTNGIFMWSLELVGDKLVYKYKVSTADVTEAMCTMMQPEWKEDCGPFGPSR